MYKIMSSWYGQLSQKNNLDDAKFWATCYATKARDGETISVWVGCVKVYEA